MKFFKILNEEEKHNGLQYKTGLNTDSVPFNPERSCQPGGIYFSDSKHICKFLDYGIWIREVILSEDSKIYKDPEGNKYKADKVILKKRRFLKVVSTWKWMKEQGVRLINSSIDWASEHGHLEVVKYLWEQGVRPTDNAINWASRNGHLEVIKFFCEQGVRPTNDAIDWASQNGYLKIVKFLVEQGVRPTDYAINWAYENGHSKVGQFLEKYM